MNTTDYYLPLLFCVNKIVDGDEYDERHMHGDFHVWMDRGLRYTSTTALSQRLFSGSSLEWIELPSIQLWYFRPSNCERKFAIQSLFMSYKNTCYWTVSLSSWQYWQLLTAFNWQRAPLVSRNLEKSVSPTQAHRRLWCFFPILKFLKKHKWGVALGTRRVDRF